MEIRTTMMMTVGFQLMLNMTRSFIALYGLELGANTLDIGLLISAFGMAAMFFAIQSGKLADRIGDKIPIAVGYIGFTLGILLPYLMPSMITLFLSQVLVGVAIIVINISLQNILSRASTNRNRDKNFGLFSVYLSLGGFLGQVFGGYLADHFSYSVVFGLSALVAIIQLPLLALITSRKRENTPTGKDYSLSVEAGTLQLLKNTGLRKALLASALALYSRDLFIAFFPLLAVQQNMTSSEIGWIIAIQSLSMVSVRLFLSPLVRGISRRSVLFISICLAGIAYLLLPQWDSIYFYGFISFVLGIGLGCGQPLSMSVLHELSPQNRTAEIIGLRLAINRLSIIAAPLFFGTMASWIGLYSIFYLNGAFLIAGSWFTRTPRLQESTNSERDIRVS